ncbi:cytochrome c nitrite reductase small subunit [Capnocytophaga canis]|uniref:cytochrome c nitrite reductase small subunit n=1 Tax=Capnocytophaga canis TaxID=1848903 RepID=UPI001561C241|nr:cytochrome c nitrite reductase small subunit [Capnocytophaga canis]
MATGSKEKKKFSLIPPPQWRLPALIVIGAMFGLGFYALYLSRATSYMSDDPKACINCHVMTPHYMTWNKSSHREVASCNDCHVPQDNMFSKYYFKAKDGLWHSYVFTTRNEPEVIRAKDASVEVIHQNCVRCHIDQVTDAKLESDVANHIHSRTDRLCWECHREVPHGAVKSLSSIGFQIEPTQFDNGRDSVRVMEWIKNSNESKSK